MIVTSRAGIAFALSILGLAGCATDPLSAFDRYAQSSEFVASITASVGGAQPGLPPCENADVTYQTTWPGKNLGIVVAMRNGRPVPGSQWQEFIHISGCGQSRSWSGEVMVLEQGKLRHAIGVQGDSRMTVSLQRKVADMILSPTGILPPCGTSYVSEAKFAGTPFRMAASKAWDEDWVLNICGKTAVMRVHVTPEDPSNFKLGFDRVRWASSS